MSFVAGGGALEPMAAAADGALPPELLRAFDVFGGEMTCCRLGHAGGTRPCDKERLVIPMLGLFLELYADADAGDAAAAEMLRALEAHLDDIYPHSFEYAGADGTTTTLPLFGDLVAAAKYYHGLHRGDGADGGGGRRRPPRFAPGAVAARREGAGNIAGELRKTMTERTLASSPSLKKRSILGGLAGHTCEATPSARITPDVERGTRGAEGA